MQKIKNNVKILEYPSPFLQQKTISVKSLKNPFVLKTIEELKLVMQELKAEAVGLAANQIGESYKVFAYRDYTRGEVFIIVNPLILSKSNRYIPSIEGCLSFPGKKKITVKRFSEITVKYQKENGESVTEKITETSDNLKLFVWQHEIDHLNGILFNQIDKVWENK